MTGLRALVISLSAGLAVAIAEWVLKSPDPVGAGTLFGAGLLFGLSWGVRRKRSSQDATPWPRHEQ
jgi:hypothetical protein